MSPVPGNTNSSNKFSGVQKKHNRYPGIYGVYYPEKPEEFPWYILSILGGVILMLGLVLKMVSKDLARERPLEIGKKIEE